MSKGKAVYLSKLVVDEKNSFIQHWARLGDSKISEMVSAHSQERKKDVPWGGMSYT